METAKLVSVIDKELLDVARRENKSVLRQKDIVPDHTPCRYQAEMARQSVVVPIRVLMMDEKKYTDIIDVLNQLETWTHDIYSQAGICDTYTIEDHVTT